MLLFFYFLTQKCIEHYCGSFRNLFNCAYKPHGYKPTQKFKSNLRFTLGSKQTDSETHLDQKWLQMQGEFGRNLANFKSFPYPAPSHVFMYLATLNNSALKLVYIYCCCFILFYAAEFPVAVTAFTISSVWKAIETQGPLHCVLDVEGFPMQPFSSGAFQNAFKASCVVPNNKGRVKPL